MTWTSVLDLLDPGLYCFWGWRKLETPTPRVHTELWLRSSGNSETACCFSFVKWRRIMQGIHVGVWVCSFSQTQNRMWKLFHILHMNLCFTSLPNRNRYLWNSTRIPVLLIQRCEVLESLSKRPSLNVSSAGSTWGVQIWVDKSNLKCHVVLSHTISPMIALTRYCSIYNPSSILQRLLYGSTVCCSSQRIILAVLNSTCNIVSEVWHSNYTMASILLEYPWLGVCSIL